MYMGQYAKVEIQLNRNALTIHIYWFYFAFFVEFHTFFPLSLHVVCSFVQFASYVCFHLDGCVGCLFFFYFILFRLSHFILILVPLTRRSHIVWIWIVSSSNSLYVILSILKQITITLSVYAFVTELKVADNFEKHFSVGFFSLFLLLYGNLKPSIQWFGYWLWYQMQWNCHEFHNFNAIVIACKKMFAFYAFFSMSLSFRCKSMWFSYFKSSSSVCPLHLIFSYYFICPNVMESMGFQYDASTAVRIEKKLPYRMLRIIRHKITYFYCYGYFSTINVLYTNRFSKYSQLNMSKRVCYV